MFLTTTSRNVFDVHLRPSSGLFEVYLSVALPFLLAVGLAN
jgi:hypothetical protein